MQTKFSFDVVKLFLISLILIQVIFVFSVAYLHDKYNWDEMAHYVSGLYYADSVPEILTEYVQLERHALLSWMSGFFTLVGLEQVHLNFITPIFFVLFIVLTYFIGKKFFDEKTGIISAVIVSFSASLVLNSVKLIPDIMAAFFLSAAIFMCYMGLNKPKLFFPAGILASLSVMAHDSNFILSLFLILFYVFFHNKINKKYFFVSILAGLIVLVPYFLENYTVWEDPLFRIQFHSDFVSDGVGFNHIPLNVTKMFWSIFLPYSISVGVFILAAYYLAKKGIFSKERTKFIFLWMITYIIPLPFLVLDSRNVLPLLIPFSILAAESLRILWKSKHRNLIFVIFMIAFGINYLLPPTVLYGFLIDGNLSVDFSLENIFSDVLNTNILTDEENSVFEFLRSDSGGKGNIIVTNYSPPSLIASNIGLLAMYDLDLSCEPHNFELTNGGMEYHEIDYVLHSSYYDFGIFGGSMIDDSKAIKIFETNGFTLYKCN